jgi:hypothetical protein
VGGVAKVGEQAGVVGEQAVVVAIGPVVNRMR